MMLGILDLKLQNIVYFIRKYTVFKTIESIIIILFLFCETKYVNRHVFTVPMIN